MIEFTEGWIIYVEKESFNKNSSWGRKESSCILGKGDRSKLVKSITCLLPTEAVNSRYRLVLFLQYH